MTDIAEATSAPAESSGATRKRKGSGLDSMVLPELKQLAGSLGLKGTGALRKGQLIDAIRSAQGNAGSAGPASSGPASSGGTSNGNGGASRRGTGRQGGSKGGASGGGSHESAAPSEAPTETAPRRNDDVATALDELQRAPREEAAPTTRDSGDSSERSDTRESDESGRDGQGERRTRRTERGARDGQARDGQPRDNNDRGNQNRDGGNQNRDGGNQNRDGGNQNRDGGNQNRDGGQARDNNDRGNQNRETQRDNPNRDWDDDGGRRGRRRRSRDRQGRQRNTRTSGGGNVGMDRYESDPTVSEDDVLVPARGILDVLDNYAFVRTSGYLPGNDDAYVSLSMVKKFALRKGDVITGQIRATKEGDRKEKFNPLVRLETVNGLDPEQVKNRADFGKLTPLYPQERLKMETVASNLTGRIIDLICPVGKGQRGLIVSPSKSGKTMIMQSIANSISANNPEVHLMVVLVDERPEEVTDFQRAVQGEVIASTFDRPADDHTTVAELAIERAKRLVEVGRDVVVLLDGITRLGRAYNIAAPASGRILSGGVDSAALYPPKKFFGAARNIEGGGSLTILATALVETGSKMDEVIFEEFKGTGNMELRLRREFSEKRIFPAIDVDASSTRREELLMSREELQIVWKLRRVIGGLDNLQGLEMLLDRLRKTQSNHEFLSAITKSIPQ